MVAGLIASSVTPFSTVSSVQLCTMACSAGMLPHMAGECQHGDSHGHLSHSQPKPVAEVLCGGKNLDTVANHSHENLTVATDTAEPDTIVATEHEHEGSSDPNANKIARTSFSQPCSLDCTGSVFTSRNPNRPHHLSAACEAQRPRPPSDIRLVDVEYSVARKHDALCRKCAGRAPPVSLSYL